MTVGRVAIVLKPCPCCSKTATVDYQSGSWGYYPAKYRARCTGCGLMTPWVDDKETDTKKGQPTSADMTVQAVAAIWNKRVVESEA